MSAKHLTNQVVITLDLVALTWLRNFLKYERNAAEIDHEEVERLHTDVAINAAKVALNHELAQMTKAIDALDVAIVSDDAREAIAKQLADEMPPAA